MRIKSYRRKDGTCVDSHIRQNYKKYKSNTNMSCSEIKRWAYNPASKKASIGRSAIKRNIKLQCKPVNIMNCNDLKDLKKANSYLARAKKINKSKIKIYRNYTKNEIALKNWAYDSKK